MIPFSEKRNSDLGLEDTEELGGVPPGKQGKFDRVYAEFDSDGDLVNLHVIEAKGGGSTLGARTIGDGSVAQQGTQQYRDSIFENLLEKLPENDALREALEEAQILGKDVLSYVLVRQGVDSKNNFIVKTFP